MKLYLSSLQGIVLKPLLLIMAVFFLTSCGGGGGGGDTSSGGTGGTGGSGFSAADLQGYQWIITDSDGTNSAEPFVFNANGTVSHPGNTSFTSGSYTVGANGAFSASLNFGGTVVTLTGTMNAAKTRVSGTEGGAVSGSFTLDKSSTSTVGSVGGTGKLNDTGITACWDETSVLGKCATADLGLWADLNQDGQTGRDALAAKGQLTKVGGGSAGFDFTKIGANGEKLPANASSWSCVLDNVTGLMWEVKTADGGLRDMNKTYTWYNPDAATNSGLGYENGGVNTQAFVNNVNAKGLCGHNDWRLPDRMELLGLVDLSKAYPAIDMVYFPNTAQKSDYWTSSPSAANDGYAWAVHFDAGDAYIPFKNSSLYVRVVRSGQ